MSTGSRQEPCIATGFSERPTITSVGLSSLNGIGTELLDKKHVTPPFTVSISSLTLSCSFQFTRVGNMFKWLLEGNVAALLHFVHHQLHSFCRGVAVPRFSGQNSYPCESLTLLLVQIRYYHIVGRVDVD